MPSDPSVGAAACLQLRQQLALRPQVRLPSRKERAARQLGFVDAQFQALGMKREITELLGYDKLMTALRRELSEADIQKLGAEGEAWSEDRAVEEAMKIDEA